ncbi:hypothetical protein [Kaistia sp. MMO-174]|uniref:hypothetical protein n=1 Tax=Kaistia sp. MMO-174 TaxID=3081256 RepID=UPI00301AF1CB
MNVHPRAIDADRVGDGRDALNEIHAATGTMKAVLDHIYDLSLRIGYNVVPDAKEMETIHALLAMSTVWASQIDHDVGQASAQHTKALALRVA